MQKFRESPPGCGQETDKTLQVISFSPIPTAALKERSSTGIHTEQASFWIYMTKIMSMFTLRRPLQSVLVQLAQNVYVRTESEKSGLPYGDNTKFQEMNNYKNINNIRPLFNCNDYINYFK